jgi:hypothetical protein
MSVSISIDVFNKVTHEINRFNGDMEEHVRRKPLI